ncbi:MAG: RNA-binding protein [Lachnospiraceae bacterium]|nr:RNA-binding protein [Lachnospiraceae bacterium]
MNKEEQMLCSHLEDLANACYQRDRAVISDFLTLNEQNLFLSFCVRNLPPVTYELIGGYESAERKAVYFQPIGVGREHPAPLVLLRVKPVNRKFAEDLSHRDYLGSLMNLGIDRCKLGDLIPSEEGCLIICQEAVSGFICEQLTRVRHTTVLCEIQELSEFDFHPETKQISGTVASLRLDAVIGLAFSSSRSKLTGYIEGEKVFVNGKCITSNAYPLKENDLVSVRGLGKFRFLASNGQTKKGRLSVLLELFI